MEINSWPSDRQHFARQLFSTSLHKYLYLSRVRRDDDGPDILRVNNCSEVDIAGNFYKQNGKYYDDCCDLENKNAPECIQNGTQNDFQNGIQKGKTEKDCYFLIRILIKLFCIYNINKIKKRPRFLSSIFMRL